MHAFLLAISTLLPAAPAPEPGGAAPDPAIRKLQAELVATTKEFLAFRRAQATAGKIPLSELREAAKRLRDAELAYATKPAERVAAHLAYFALSVEVDEQTVSKFEAGAISQGEFYDIRATRLEAEIDLRKAGGKPPRGTKSAAKPKPLKEADGR
jgi:hypothetical protein